MFSYEEIQKFNETEILIYKFIISNIEKIPYMTIRELASDIHISTSTYPTIFSSLVDISRTPPGL